MHFFFFDFDHDIFLVFIEFVFVWVLSDRWYINDEDLIGDLFYYNSSQSSKSSNNTLQNYPQPAAVPSPLSHPHHQHKDTPHWGSLCCWMCFNTCSVLSRAEFRLPWASWQFWLHSPNYRERNGTYHHHRDTNSKRETKLTLKSKEKRGWQRPMPGQKPRRNRSTQILP